MTEALIISAVRTPIARSFKGGLVGVDAFELAGVVLEATLTRSAVPSDAADDLVLAESYQGGGVIGRNVAVRAGLDSVPGLAQNRWCASGLAAVATAAGSVRAGMDRLVLAGGTESLSTAPACVKPAAEGTWQPWNSLSHPDRPDAPALDMPHTVGENTAKHAGLTRGDVDAWSLRSHQRAIDSMDNGWFDNEIVPVVVGDKKFAVDEHPRRNSSMEVLAGLPVLHPEIDGATVTAGNSAGLNDAAAMVGVAGDDFVRTHGLVPLARVRSWASVGVDPALTGTAPSMAIPKALERAGLSIADVDRFEINEAFASVPAACVRELGLDEDIVNVNGSGVSLGHPIAATGARMIVTMVNELRRNALSIGCVSMCAGGGMGAAMVIEVV
ncbi:thiolase family protein [Gordonia rhizosphera]|uniref:Probable acetyl-CoA acetyltransferase n=1 Tax=Gordonia rhizosphera NBRC 16068 TaxID=1108045 RepID=K6W0H4_9ACTN|nr:thiolase family protein [Gordonia rhizosphera]GAB92670.1 putative acetyl-CoA acyltransferase [Gordonia rhizosphera NBRC 16068]